MGAQRVEMEAQRVQMAARRVQIGAQRVPKIGQSKTIKVIKTQKRQNKQLETLKREILIFHLFLYIKLTPWKIH